MCSSGPIPSATPVPPVDVSCEGFLALGSSLREEFKERDDLFTDEINKSLEALTASFSGQISSFTDY